MLNFSFIASPISDLTGEPEKVRWTGEAEQAFWNLKATLTNSPVLRNPDLSLPFLVHMDASETGFGAVLSQNFDGKEHPIISASCKLTLAEKRYAAVKREALAIKWELEELCYYLMG